MWHTEEPEGEAENSKQYCWNIDCQVYDNLPSHLSHIHTFPMNKNLILDSYHPSKFQHNITWKKGSVMEKKSQKDVYGMTNKKSPRVKSPNQEYIFRNDNDSI